MRVTQVVAILVATVSHVSSVASDTRELSLELGKIHTTYSVIRVRPVVYFLHRVEEYDYKYYNHKYVYHFTKNILYNIISINFMYKTLDIDVILRATTSYDYARVYLSLIHI